VRREVPARIDLVHAGGFRAAQIVYESS